MSIATYLPSPEAPHFRADDPTAAMREARYEARKAAVDVADVEAELSRRLPDILSDHTNALTRAVHDIMAAPPEDRWELDGLVKLYPYRYLVEVGRACVRLIGESHLAVGDRIDDTPF
jgi:hypothetical protein